MANRGLAMGNQRDEENREGEGEEMLIIKA
jgi:hypothetical protein